MPVFPLVESMMVLSRVSAPARSPSRIMFSAGRSLTEPPGFAHSALPYISTRGFPTRLASLISGVFPMRSSKDAGALLEATTTARVSDGITIHTRLAVHRSSVSEAQHGNASDLSIDHVAHVPRAVPMVKRIE